jgi:hypothetical protein
MKNPFAEAFTDTFYQVLKKEIMTVPQKLFQNIKQGGIRLNLIYDTNIMLIRKPDRDITTKLNCAVMSIINIKCKSSQQNTTK